MQNLIQEKMATIGMPLESTSEETEQTPEERKQKEYEHVEGQCKLYNDSEGALNKKDGYECELCKNRGYTAEVFRNEMFGYYYEGHVPCKCLKVRDTIRRLERSGLKNIIRDYTFAKFEATEPWQQSLKNAAIKFVKDTENSWFFIGGQSGSGKTHICTAIAGYYLKHGKNTKYMLWRDDVTRIKANITDSTEYAKAMDELKNVEVLYIDDLFKTGKDNTGKPAQPTAADVNIAFEIINYRYNNPELITVISSERSIQALTEIDEAIGGRIAEQTMQAGYGFNIKPDPNKNHRIKGCVEL